MSRYIDIDDISLRKTISVGGLSAKALWRRVQQEPSIDIVRCKECKWFDADENESDSWHLCTRHFGMYINFAEDDYCSYGERKE